MKKYLFLPILLFFISCTAVNVSKVVSDSGISTVNSEIAETIEDLKEAAKLNECEKYTAIWSFKINIPVFGCKGHYNFKGTWNNDNKLWKSKWLLYSDLGKERGKR